MEQTQTQTQPQEQTTKKTPSYISGSKLKLMFNGLKSVDMELAKEETPEGEKSKKVIKSLSSSVATWIVLFVDTLVKDLFTTYDFMQDSTRLKSAQLFESHIKLFIPETCYPHLHSCDDDLKELKFIDVASSKYISDFHEKLGGGKFKKNSEGAAVLNHIRFLVNKYVLYLLVDKLASYEYLCNISGKSSIRNPVNNDYAYMFKPLQIHVVFDYGTSISRMCESLKTPKATKHEQEHEHEQEQEQEQEQEGHETTPTPAVKEPATQEQKQEKKPKTRKPKQTTQ